ncbi:NADH-quinone oxidoreductase subunit C [Muricoccus radiodurans]|uniref:hydrogenase large subunit n=1 Tax=Muricoccus radiodurans TaxID=2231721 RepID=UPI003CF4E2BA
MSAPANHGPATAIIRNGRPHPLGRSHQRYLLTAESWSLLPAALAAEPELELMGLWAEPGFVHAAFLMPDHRSLLLASAPLREGRYAALSPVRPGAAWYERAVRDLWAIEAVGGVDLRPWLDHGCWHFEMPLSGRPVRRSVAPPQPAFLPAEGEGVHQIPVGPVHAGIIEPGHFRFHVRGETIVRLETRLGYAHKGTIGLMLGKSPRAAARYAARISGDSTVAHSWAFAMAAEAATGAEPPPRALALRAVMAECERVANHLGDWGAVLNDAAFAAAHARTGMLREGLLRACDAAFGHRLMMDRILPGGVAQDLAPGGIRALTAALGTIAAALPELAALYEDHASLGDRTIGTGTIPEALATRFAAGGVVGRASGRPFDARDAPGYAPYEDVAVTLRAEGDVDARLRIRLDELRESLRLLDGLLATLPDGPLSVPLRPQEGEGLGLVEGFRGEALHWMALDDGGLIRAVFPRDASWAHWPLLEAAMIGNIVGDFPLVNKSINASYSGVDL